MSPFLLVNIGGVLNTELSYLILEYIILLKEIYDVRKVLDEATPGLSYLPYIVSCLTDMVFIGGGWYGKMRM